MKINITKNEAWMMMNALEDFSFSVSEMEEEDVGASGYGSLEIRALETAKVKIQEAVENDQHKKSS